MLSGAAARQPNSGCRQLTFNVPSVPTWRVALRAASCIQPPPPAPLPLPPLLQLPPIGRLLSPPQLPCLRRLFGLNLQAPMTQRQRCCCLLHLTMRLLMCFLLPPPLLPQARSSPGSAVETSSDCESWCSCQPACRHQFACWCSPCNCQAWSPGLSPSELVAPGVLWVLCSPPPSRRRPPLPQRHRIILCPQEVRLPRPAHHEVTRCACIAKCKAPPNHSLTSCNLQQSTKSWLMPL